MGVGSDTLTSFSRYATISAKWCDLGHVTVTIAHALVENRMPDFTWRETLNENMFGIRYTKCRSTGGFSASSEHLVIMQCCTTDYIWSATASGVAGREVRGSGRRTF